jgi:CMP-N,N'-diacetyllegionaminic acid synthase
MKILALIPARGGSKGIPRKNVKTIAGKPLIVWTIEAALRSPSIHTVVVSTDDEEIAAVALQAGAQVPFMRPAELASDGASGMAPVMHALDMLPDFDAVLLLQPTSPLRSTADIDACLALAAARAASAVVSVTEPDAHPYWTYRLDDELRMQPMVDAPAVTRRQDLPLAGALNGALYYAKTAWLRENDGFMGADTLAYMMPRERSVDIDTPFDWKFAELLLKELE